MGELPLEYRFSALPWTYVCLCEAAPKCIFEPESQTPSYRKPICESLQREYTPQIRSERLLESPQASQGQLQDKQNQASPVRSEKLRGQPQLEPEPQVERLHPQINANRTSNRKSISNRLILNCTKSNPTRSNPNCVSNTDRTRAPAGWTGTPTNWVWTVWATASNKGIYNLNRYVNRKSEKALCHLKPNHSGPTFIYFDFNAT